MAKLLFLDGNSLTYRAFFALPTDMAISSGQVTNAVYGFTVMLINLIRDHEPDGLVVAFDRPEPTFRHLMLPQYKAQRDPTPELLLQQFPLVRNVLDVLKIPAVETIGFEADDALATLATRAAANGDEAVIVTGDRDLYQMVSDPLIRVLYNRRGVSDYALYDEAGIKERTGVTPAQYAMYAALRGDPSDNLPGVPGVGEKTAARLINDYDDLDGIFANVDKQTPKLRENLKMFEERARTNHQAMVLRKDAPIELDIADLRWGELDASAVKNLFEELEFVSLYERLNGILLGRLPALESSVKILETPALIEESSEEKARLFAQLLKQKDQVLPVGWATAPSGFLVALAIATDTETGNVLCLNELDLAHLDVQIQLRRLASGVDCLIDTHNAKGLIKALSLMEIEMACLRLDTAVAAYLIDPSGSKYLLEEILFQYCQLKLPDGDLALEGQLDFDRVAVSVETKTANDALCVAHLSQVLSELLEVKNMSYLYEEIERPLIGVLARMEQIGVAIDLPELTSLRDRLVSEVGRLEQEIHEAAGRSFNVNSTKQLREVLFEDLQLTPQKKTKTGFSTDAASLEKIREQHPVVEMLISYREVEKLRSTYGQGLLDVVGSDGRIHATFNQTVARTGRLSSEDPNLHNIPVRTAQGRQFRSAFIATKGFELLVADYNQIELRVIAHLSEDPGLIDAFAKGTDIHNATAASVFGVSPEDVSVEQRSKAKMISYGLAYGMEAYGLAQRLGISNGEAAEILSAYFLAFPKVKSFMETVVSETKAKGYTETMFGRRRPMPELNASNFRVRQAAERQAMNAPIQGLAADIFKVALVRLDRELRRTGAASVLVLQVHDEVILEVHPDEKNQILDLTVETMCNATDLKVPLEVHVSSGNSWGVAKG